MAQHEPGSRSTAGRPTAAGPVVLLVLPDPVLRELLAECLRAAGCYPLPVASAAEGERLAQQLLPDLLLIDADAVPAPDRAWAERLATTPMPPADTPVPTVALTTAAAPSPGPGMQVVRKPIRPRELTARLMRLLKNPGAEPLRPRASGPLRAGPLEIDREQPVVRVQRGQQWWVLDLPRTEHRVLEALASAPERVRSRDEIRRSVWPGAAVDLRTVDQYVRRLRRSLQTVGAGHLVKTISRAGYRLQPEPLPTAPAQPGAVAAAAAATAAGATPALPTA